MNELVRKQVYITEEQDRLLKRAARLEGRPEAEIVRSALDRALKPKKSAHRTARDSLWDIVGLGRTRAADVATQVDHYLYGAPKK